MMLTAKKYEKKAMSRFVFLTMRAFIILIGFIAAGMITDSVPTGHCREASLFYIQGDSIDMNRVAPPDQQQSSRDNWLNQMPSSLKQANTIPAVSVFFPSIDISQFPAIIIEAEIRNLNNAAVGGLSDFNFALSEDGAIVVKQLLPIRTAGGMVVSLVIDSSGSMGGSPLDKVKAAAKHLIDAAGPSDRLEIISCSDFVTVLKPFSADKAVLKQIIDSITASGQTALHDGILKGVGDAANEKGTKAVVVFTDGQDNVSGTCRQDESCLVNLIKMQPVPVYAIGMGKSVNANGLKTISTATDGYYLYEPDPPKIALLYQDMAKSLTESYLFQYTSPKPDYDGLTRIVALAVISSSGSCTRLACPGWCARAGRSGSGRRRTRAWSCATPSASAGCCRVTGS